MAQLASKADLKLTKSLEEAARQERVAADNHRAAMAELISVADLKDVKAAEEAERKERVARDQHHDAMLVRVTIRLPLSPSSPLQRSLFVSGTPSVPIVLQRLSAYDALQSSTTMLQYKSSLPRQT